MSDFLRLRPSAERHFSHALAYGLDPILLDRHRARHPTWRDRVHSYTIRRQLFRPGFRETEQSRLRRTVRGPKMVPNHTPDRGDVDDRAGAERLHAWDHSARGEERTLHVHVEHAIEHRFIYGIDRGAISADPSIVDQDADRPQRRFDTGDERCHRSGIRDINDCFQDPPAMLAYDGRGLRHTVRHQIMDHHVGAVLCQQYSVG